jgi:hypothetical protein
MKRFGFDNIFGVVNVDIFTESQNQGSGTSGKGLRNKGILTSFLSSNHLQRNPSTPNITERRRPILPTDNAQEELRIAFLLPFEVRDIFPKSPLIQSLKHREIASRVLPRIV